VAASQTMKRYEQGLAAPRQKLATLQALGVVMQPDVDKALLELFLIHFNSMGVGMTEPVDVWMRRAGQSCVKLGLKELGETFEHSAQTEAGHHLMMIADTKKLVDRWNARHAFKLNADELLKRQKTPGVVAYHQLHDDTIAGPAPYGQLAIEYEIEALSERHGVGLIQHCVKTLGKDIVAELSFIQEHTLLDVGHTKLKQLEMSALLDRHPDFLDALVRAGAGALEAYGQFLTDCFIHAQEVWRKAVKSGA